MNEIVEPDIVTESHQHYDHTDVSMLKGTYKLIKTAGEFAEKGITITGIPGKHNKGDTEGSNFIYIFNINGIRIAHFASQGELPSNEVMKKNKNVDILLLQASLRQEYADTKLNLKECKLIIEKLNPKVVIPEHGTPQLGKTLAKYLNTVVQYGNTGELVITKNELNNIRGVKVIDLDTE